MKKLLLFTCLVAMILLGCKKDNPQPKSAAPVTPTAWTGLYCVSFYNQVGPNTYDTLGKSCGTDDTLNYYSHNPNRYNAQYVSGKKIQICSQCQ